MYFKNLKERSVWLRTLKMAFLPIRINLDRRVAPAPSVTYVLPPLVLPITINVPGPVVQAEWMHTEQGIRLSVYKLKMVKGRLRFRFVYLRS